MSIVQRGAVSPIGEDMTEAEARQTVEGIRSDVDSVRFRLWDLRERRGWAALGYRSFRECIAAEFPQHESYLYRQLNAAEIEAEISPNGEIGRIAEGKLRPLAEVPPGERKPVWDKAKAAAGADPTGRQVEAAVREVKPPRPKSQTRHVEDRSADFPDEDFRQDSPEPEDLPAEASADDEDARAEADEPTPASAPSHEPFVVPSFPAKVNHPTSLIEREPGEEDEPEDEKEWLETLPLNRILANEPQKLFRADARIYRRFLATREAYRDPATEAFGNLSRKGAFGSTLARLLKANDPKHWHKCPPTAMDDGAGCDGLGFILGDKCTVCNGRGYLLFPLGRPR